MPRLERADDVRGRLGGWYVDSLRPQLMRAVSQRRVSAVRAHDLENRLRDLLTLPAPALQRARADRPHKRT